MLAHAREFFPLTLAAASHRLASDLGSSGRGGSMRRFAAILVGVLVVSTVLLTVAPAHATAPGKNGRIAFRRYFNADHTYGAIFTIKPDGTGIGRSPTRPGRSSPRSPTGRRTDGGSLTPSSFTATRTSPGSTRSTPTGPAARPWEARARDHA